MSVDEKIGSVPYDIGPLPIGELPRLTPEEVLARISQQDVLVEFFSTPRDLESVLFKVGLVTDHSLVDDSTSNDPTFRGYVVEGGHSNCVSSGPDRPPTSEPTPNQIGCHVLVVVNGDTGEIRSESEIGE